MIYAITTLVILFLGFLYWWDKRTKKNLTQEIQIKTRQRVDKVKKEVEDEAERMDQEFQEKLDNLNINNINEYVRMSNSPNSSRRNKTSR